MTDPAREPITAREQTTTLIAVTITGAAAFLLFLAYDNTTEPDFHTDNDTTTYQQWDTTTCEAVRLQALDNTATNWDRSSAAVDYDNHC